MLGEHLFLESVSEFLGRQVELHGHFPLIVYSRRPVNGVLEKHAPLSTIQILLHGKDYEPGDLLVAANLLLCGSQRECPISLMVKNSKENEDQNNDADR